MDMGLCWRYKEVHTSQNGRRNAHSRRKSPASDFRIRVSRRLRRRPIPELTTSVVFSPCPSGFLNLDCSRVYESLECGAIPIVEKRGSFDYFRALLGAHPMPTIDDWVEAPLLIKHLIQQHKMNDLQQQCTSWWRLYKNQLGYQMRRDILHMV